MAEQQRLVMLAAIGKHHDGIRCLDSELRDRRVRVGDLAHTPFDPDDLVVGERPPPTHLAVVAAEPRDRMLYDQVSVGELLG